MTEKKYNIAIAGATGLVGETMLSILEQINFPFKKVYVLASSRSSGKTISFKGDDLIVQELETFNFDKVDIGLFSPGASVSAVHAPRAVDAGCIVIDNTSQFRYDDDVPLVVTEVNPHVISGYKKKGIIANPNCSTIQMLVALKPIYDAVGIERINVCTYQAVSGTGKEAIDELANQSINIMNAKDIESSVYSKQIAFNVIPHIDEFQSNKYTKEEMKMVWETKKIFEDDSILVNPTAVRVPVFYGHSEAIHIETKEKIGAESAKELLKKMPGVTVIDEQKDGGYPTAVTEAAGENPVFVGRIREDISHPRGLNMWVVSDNVRKGAALNSIQIADILVKNYI
ncbi:MAG: aspartate-semialdehyde dehydrogenase [Legionellales bacterium]|jgi:aspartate-semialdehyde dehydrogenase|nr:aspartate-semialdehyde dehydrogenase [Legionellales bacterium]MBK69307.1 aspartate-semialdehyde dehydrogenase [Legionellales bacterium]|tara:strand:- start:413 stop:1438 length:1026 start_codon:yes stop_codon:yes gene_type:complete